MYELKTKHIMNVMTQPFLNIVRFTTQLLKWQKSTHFLFIHIVYS